MATANTKKAAPKAAAKATAARTVKAKAATKSSKVAKPEKKSQTIKTRLKKAASITQSTSKKLESLEKHNAMPVNEAAPPAMTAVATAVAADKIQSIMVRFTNVVRDVKNRVCPTGTATITYGNGNTLETAISGGAHVKTYGISDAVTSKPVFRIEGRYYRNYKNQPMPFACFYNGGEALHVGRLDTISHGCVHVADWDAMKQIHDDVVKNRTRVTVRYAPGILDKIWNQHM